MHSPNSAAALGALLFLSKVFASPMDPEIVKRQVAPEGVPAASNLPINPTVSPYFPIVGGNSVAPGPTGTAAGTAPAGTAPAGTAPPGTAPPVPSGTAPSSPASSSTTPTTGGSGFNAAGSNNMVVYYGQSPDTSSVPMSQLCSNPDVDVVILSFLNSFTEGSKGYPGLNLGAACSGGPNSAQQAAGATGLLSCPDLGKDITACQASGKKVMLSLGGSAGDSAFASDDQAKDLATKVWDLFGEGTGESAEMRPFGSAVINGFDIDNENKKPEHYTTFVSTLRPLTKAAKTCKYISAAPQCPIPDASIPLDAMKTMDFIFVQFYNNGNCNVDQPGFVDSFKQWSSQIGSTPKLYVGAPGCKECAGSGYVPAPQMADNIKKAVGAGVNNLGGVMLWDGASAAKNGDFLKTVHAALG